MGFGMPWTLEGAEQGGHEPLFWGSFQITILWKAGARVDCFLMFFIKNTLFVIRSKMSYRTYAVEANS